MRAEDRPDRVHGTLVGTYTLNPHADSKSLRLLQRALLQHAIVLVILATPALAQSARFDPALSPELEFQSEDPTDGTHARLVMVTLGEPEVSADRRIWSR